MLNAIISVICYKSKTLANGENPLMLRICKDGKKTYKSLGISVNAKYWSFSKNMPKPNCPDRHKLIKILISKKLRFKARFLN